VVRSDTPAVDGRYLLRVASSGVATGLLLCGSACSDSASLSGVDAGHAFLGAYRPFRTVGGLEAERSIIQPEAARRECPSYPRSPGPKLRRKLDEALYGASGIREERTLARPYVAFSMRVSRLKLKPHSLQVVVRADVTVAAEVKHLIGARFDLCSFFSRWKAHAWSRRFERRALEMPFGRAHAMNRHRIRRASSAATAAVPELRRLGLSFQEAVEIASSARF